MKKEKIIYKVLCKSHWRTPNGDLATYPEGSFIEYPKREVNHHRAPKDKAEEAEYRKGFEDQVYTKKYLRNWKGFYDLHHLVESKKVKEAEESREAYRLRRQELINKIRIASYKGGDALTKLLQRLKQKPPSDKT